MDIKHRAKQLFGALLLLMGGYLSLLTILRLIFGHMSSIWRAGDFVVLGSLSAYLIYAGLRLTNPKRFKPSGFGWGKIVFGSLILYSNIESHYHVAPEGPIPLLKPSNPTQAVSMKLTGIVLGLICVYLIFRGIWQGFSRHPQPDTESPQPPV